MIALNGWKLLLFFISPGWLIIWFVIPSYENRHEGAKSETWISSSQIRSPLTISSVSSLLKMIGYKHIGVQKIALFRDCLLQVGLKLVEIRFDGKDILSLVAPAGYMIERPLIFCS